MHVQWSAQIQVRWTSDAPAFDSWDWMREWEEVKWVGGASGEWDMEIWLDLATPQELDAFVRDRLWSKKWVAQTQAIWHDERLGNQAA